MVTFAYAPDAKVGDRIQVRIDEVDGEFNWVGARVDTAADASAAAPEGGKES